MTHEWVEQKNKEYHEQFKDFSGWRTDFVYGDDGESQKACNR